MKPEDLTAEQKEIKLQTSSLKPLRVVQANPARRMENLHVRNVGAQMFGTMIGVGMLNAVAGIAGVNGKVLNILSD